MIESSSRHSLYHPMLLNVPEAIAKALAVTLMGDWMNRTRITHTFLTCLPIIPLQVSGSEFVFRHPLPPLFRESGNRFISFVRLTVGCHPESEYKVRVCAGFLFPFAA